MNRQGLGEESEAALGPLASFLACSTDVSLSPNVALSTLNLAPLNGAVERQIAQLSASEQVCKGAN
jgi:hypothetical protein